MVFNTELEADSAILIGHLRGMINSLRKLPADKWDWTFAPPAPTPRILAIHAMQWLQCDRQHILNSDPKSHRPVPDAPTEPEAICDAMEAEANEWEALLKSLTDEDLARVTHQFAHPEGAMNVRGYVYHMIQNLIYKHGQFSTIFFALGLDGTEPYDAPFPNPIYKSELGIG
ncbi:MAG TPA: DinB family protein [Fimbriimonas sp.]|nr:DinB family protein [Fimbriimonas sp.]